MSRRWIAVVLLACWGGFGGVRPPMAIAQRAARGRVVLLSVDGAADWIIDELIARGKAPAFEAMAREGASAEALITVMPTLTAVAHATLWTGAEPRSHGITGNSVPVPPRAEHSLIESRSGFENLSLRAEPIWITAARAGRQVLVPQATGGFPFTNQFRDKLLQFDIYANCRGDVDLVEGVLAAGADARFRFEAGEDTATMMRTADEGVTVTIGESSVSLSPGAGRFSPPVRVTVEGRAAALRLSLISFDAASGRFALVRGRICTLSSSDPARLDAFRAIAGTIVGEGVTRFYTGGRLGPTIAEGGQGEAERRFADILAANQEYFDGALAFAAREPWDLLVLYVPNLDAAGHALVGMIDPASSAYSASTAARAWPWVERIYERTVDAYVTEIRRRCADATLIVGADHGMEGASRVVYPNVILRKAGLLGVNASGQIDVAGTRAALLPGQGGGVFLNTIDHRAGIVPLDERERVKQHVIATLLAVRDPRTGAAPIRALYDTDVDGLALGIGGDGSADLYIDLNAGYAQSARVDGDLDVDDTPPTGVGDHGGAPWHRNLHAILYVAGPQAAPGKRLGVVRALDVAPTVARLLGIPPPRDSVGVPLELR